MKKLLYILGWVLMSSQAMSQQYSLYNLYYQSRYFVNPAAIEDSAYKVNFIHRNQWVGMAGAPVVNFINAEVPINDKISVGAQFMNDRVHIFNKNVFNFSGVYKLALAADHQLNFGLSAGFFQNSIQSNDATVIDQTDPTFISSGSQGAQFNVDFGLHYQWNKGLFVGVSIPYLIGNYIKLNKSETVATQYGIKRHFLTYAGYNYQLNADWMLQPEVFARFNVESKSFQTDIAVRAYWKKFLWAGMFFRTSNQMGVTLGGTIKDKVDLGYSVDFAMGPVAKGSRSSHELFVGIKINKMRANPNQKDAYTRDTVFVRDTVFMAQEEVMLEDTSVLSDSLMESTMEMDSLSESESETDTLAATELSSDSLSPELDAAALLILQENEFKDKEMEQLPEVEFDLPQGYYIIHGSFTEKARAEAMVQMYRRAGLNSFIAQDKTKMYNRVIISYSKDRNVATKDLIDIQTNYFKEAWFFSVK